ncbi:hypothetical protein HON52_01225 [Candidatus Uhrbacteria bacterium]|nr:hypothetical protein [Candidatus Uhrbacteria bacterium]
MFKGSIAQIVKLPWDRMNPVDLAFLSTVTGREFADSLRAGAEHYKNDGKILQMISEELQTDNLVYRDYSKKGDHVDMLLHFFDELKLWSKVSESVKEAGIEYVKGMSALSGEEKMMCIISREKELPVIFTKIVDSHNWKDFGLGFYEKYLRDHIVWDGEEGGHADLVGHIDVDQKVLDSFWKLRLKMYEAVPLS